MDYTTIVNELNSNCINGYKWTEYKVKNTIENDYHYDCYFCGKTTYQCYNCEFTFNKHKYTTNITNINDIIVGLLNENQSLKKRISELLHEQNEFSLMD